MKTAIRLTYTLGGTDPAAFDINVSTGQLKTKGALDYEAQSTYSIEVTATVPPRTSAAANVTIVESDPELGALGSLYDAEKTG